MEFGTADVEGTPVSGWGPGTTTLFQYAPFQAAEDRTIISTNLGVPGQRAQRILGPLSEQGVLSMLLMLALVVVTTYTVLRSYQHLAGADGRILMLCLSRSGDLHLFARSTEQPSRCRQGLGAVLGLTMAVVLMDSKYPRVKEVGVVEVDSCLSSGLIQTHRCLWSRGQVLVDPR
ncbi:MAG: hypothetical protein IPO56_06115 [Flavobacteriales bacterium]|nr:hypothetical protein [Flavobacteriales bacterium]